MLSAARVSGGFEARWGRGGLCPPVLPCGWERGHCAGHRCTGWGDLPPPALPAVSWHTVWGRAVQLAPATTCSRPKFSTRSHSCHCSLLPCPPSPAWQSHSLAVSFAHAAIAALPAAAARGCCRRWRPQRPRAARPRAAVCSTRSCGCQRSWMQRRAMRRRLGQSRGCWASTRKREALEQEATTATAAEGCSGGVGSLSLLDRPVLIENIPQKALRRSINCINCINQLHH